MTRTWVFPFTLIGDTVPKTWLFSEGFSSLYRAFLIVFVKLVRALTGILTFSNFWKSTIVLLTRGRLCSENYWLLTTVMIFSNVIFRYYYFERMFIVIAQRGDKDFRLVFNFLGVSVTWSTTPSRAWTHSVRRKMFNLLNLSANCVIYTARLLTAFFRWFIHLHL